MASFSRNTPNKHAMANALRVLADMLDDDRANWRDFRLDRSIGFGANLKTTVSLTVEVLGLFDDPREHPAIAEQPRLPDIQGGPSLTIISGDGKMHYLTDYHDEGD